MPLWEVDFSDIDSEAEVPDDIDDEEQLPEGYNAELVKVDNFVADNLQRAKESKDVAMVGFIVEQAILRYTRLGLKKEVLDQQIWITEQLRKGILKNFQSERKGVELTTQTQYLEDMIAEQKKKETELQNRVASLRAERDFKKLRLESVIRSNQGLMNEMSHINKRRALIQERLRLDTLEYEREKALRDDLRDTFIKYSEDLDLQLQNASWLDEKRKKAARRMELEDEVKSLQADLAKFDLIEERNRIAEESERELPFKQFCVQLAELYLKREKLFKQLEEEKQNVKRLEDEIKSRRVLEESSQMDCTQAILDADLDDEETLMRMARHYKIDSQSLNASRAQAAQESQLCRKRAQSPAESTASSEANDDEISDGGEQPTAPPTKRLSIVEHIHNPDESVDEGVIQEYAQKEMILTDSQIYEEEEHGDRSQAEQTEGREGEDEEGREIEERMEEEQETIEQPEEHEEEYRESQESHATVASQESVFGENVQEEVEENERFLRPSVVPMKTVPIAVEENEDMENAVAETSFNPEMMLDISAHSNDPGGDFFEMMNSAATGKRAAVDAAGESPSQAGGDGDFMSMFGGGVGDGAAADGDAASFSFNFGGGDANETNGGGGGEFNFFGF